MIKGTKIFKVTGLTDVDPKSFNQYKDWEDVIKNKSYADTDAYIEKAKANYRWMLMSMNLNKGLETLSDIKINGGSSSEVPGSVDFILTYTQPDALWYKDEETGDIVSEDKIEIIKKIIKDTLNQDYNVILTYFDSEIAESKQIDGIEYVSQMPYGTTMRETEIEAKTVEPTVEEVEGITYQQYVPEE